MSQIFKGILAPLTTPFEGDKISCERLSENIQKYNSYELAGYVILGSSGENVYISDKEADELVQAAKKAAAQNKKIIVGAGKESTQHTLEITNRMAEWGADAAMIRTPSYFRSKMTHQALKKHFLTVAESARMPIILYNNPRLTGVSMDSQLIIELSQHPNIAGIKDSSGDLTFTGEIIPFVPADFNYLFGAAGILLSGLALGASGGIIAISDIAPSLCVKLYNMYLEKKWNEARKLQLELIPLNKAIVHTYGVPSIKYALDLLGFYGGLCRLPLLPLHDEGKKNIEKILKSLNLLE